MFWVLLAIFCVVGGYFGYHFIDKSRTIQDDWKFWPVMGVVLGSIALVAMLFVGMVSHTQVAVDIAKVEAFRDTLKHERFVNEDIERFAIFGEIRTLNAQIAERQADNKLFWFGADIWISDKWNDVMPIRVTR